MAWQAIAAQIVVRGGLWLLNKYVLNDEKKAPKPRPEAIEFPLTEIGTPIPLVYGTVRLDSLVLVWIDREDYYLQSSLNKNIYRADMLFVVGVPPSDVAGSVQVPDVLRFFYADIVTDGAAFGGGLLHGNRVVVNSGVSDETQFKAVVEFFDGRDDQELTNYNTSIAADFEIDHHWRLAGVEIGAQPGYRYQMMLAVLATDDEGRLAAGRLGDDSQVKAIGVEVRARGFSPPSTNIYDANPAWVIYDLICGPVFKLGYPTSKVDLTSFEDAADVLETEEHGCSVAVQSITHLREVLAGLLDQIDGVLYEDHADPDGKIKLRLIRAGDSSVATLDNTNMLREQYAPRVQLVNWAGAANEVVVSFTDRSLDYKQNVATADRVANYLGQSGRPRPRRVDFPFCTNSTLANRLAARELAIAARPLITMTAYVDRSMFALVPGDVVTIDRPDLNLDEVDFRVMDVDLGQLADNRIMLVLVENVFDNSLGNNPTPVEPALPYLLPIHERLITETPAWMQQRLYDAGVLTATSSSPLAYAFAVAANTDDAYAQSFKTLGTSPFVPGELSEDKPASNEWLKHATVKTEYPRSADPYDTTIGLELEDVSTALDSVLTALAASSELSDSDIAVYASSLSVLYDPETQAHEFIAFKTCATITGGWELQKVWRGLLDTAPRTWPVGTRFVHIHASYGNFVGRTPRFDGEEIDEQFVPSGSALIGSGDDPIDTFTIQSRADKPMPVSDLVLVGPDLEGTAGQPQSTTGALKAVSLFDGHASGAFGQRRANTEATILRGDEVASEIPPTETYSLVARKVSVTSDAESEVDVSTGLSSPTATYFGLAKAGHGEIDVAMRTVRSSDSATSWADPTIRVTAPHWRNLLVNSHGLATVGTTPSTSGWTNVTGTVQASQGTSSPSQSSTGAYFTSATASGSVTAFSQTVDVRGYKPEGLTALLDFYYRNFSDADDTIEVEVEALASNGSTVLDSDTSGALVGDEDLWTRVAVDLLVPAGTVFLRVTVTLTGVSEGAPSSAFAEPTLRLGQMTAQLLDNPSFDEVAASLTLSLVARDGSDVEVSGGILNPENSETKGYTITVDAVGAHTDVEVVFTIPKRASTTSGYVLDDISVAALETLIAAANGDWTVDADDSSGSGPLVLTFTQATLAEGSHEIDLSVGGLGDTWMNWQVGTSSVLGSTVYRTSTSNLVLEGSSNETAVADGGIDSSVDVGDVFCEVAWVTDPATEDEETTVEMYAILHSNAAGGTMTMVVQISDAVTCSEPTVDANSGGWSVGSWSSPGGGVQWQATLTKTSPAADTGYNIRFATTPSETGTIEIDVSVSWVGYGYTTSDSDTATVEAAVSADATSGILVPANATEWAAVMAAAGIGSGGPSALWLLQEASGNAADSIGSFTLTATAGSPALAYQQTVTGWSRKGIGPSGDNSDGKLSSTSTSLPDLDTSSALLLTYTILEATPGASREFTCLAPSFRMAARLTTTPRLQGNNSVNVATGSADPTGQVRPYVLQVDLANSVTALYDDAEKVIPTYSTTPSGKRVTLGGLGLNAPQCKHLYAALFIGTAAEMTAAQIKTLLQTLGWTVSWSP